MIPLNQHLKQDAAESLDGIPEAFHGVAQAHGRALYEFVMNVQLGGEAAERLARVAHGQYATALRLFVQAFNANGNAYAGKQGWTQSDLVACKAAIEVAFAAAPAEPEPPKIVLNS